MKLKYIYICVMAMIYYTSFGQGKYEEYGYTSFYIGYNHNPVTGVCTITSQPAVMLGSSGPTASPYIAYIVAANNMGLASALAIAVVMANIQSAAAQANMAALNAMAAAQMAAGEATAAQAQANANAATAQASYAALNANTLGAALAQLQSNTNNSGQVSSAPPPQTTWYCDNDDDGWYSQTMLAEKSPGPKWKTSTSGRDCDDTVYSKDNICNAKDPCAEIKKQLADPKFKAMIADLKDPKKLDLNVETGMYQDKEGNYKPMEALEGEPAVIAPFWAGVYQNTNHVHMIKWVDTKGNIYKVFPMPSVTDVAKVYEDFNMVRVGGVDQGNNYSGIVNRLGYFQLRYTGQTDNLSWDQLKAKRDIINNEGNRNKFIELSNNSKYSQIEAFLIFMRDIVKVTDIALYQIDDKGSKKLELDTNNQIKETPCN